MPDVDFSQPAVESEPTFFSSQINAARRFTLDLKPPASTPLAVVCGGSERCAADFRIDRSTFRYYCVEFVVAGRGTLRLNGKEHALSAGDLFIYGPGVPQYIVSDPSASLVKYFADFTGRRALPLLRGNKLAPGSIVQTSDPREIMRLFDDLITTGLRRGTRGRQLCALLLEQILHCAFETLIPARSLGSKAFATFTACRRYVVDHHLDLTDIRDVADACGVDVSYLCRLFQRYARQSPYQFLTRERMTTAGRLLCEDGLLVKQVAERLGYSDPFHFSRAFRRVQGVSPLAFQRLSERR